MRCYARVSGVAGFVDSCKLKPLRNDMRFVRAGVAAILNTVLQQKYRSEFLARVRFVYEYRALLHELIVILADDTDDGLQKGMSRADEGRDRLLINLRLFKTDTFVF